MSEPNPDFTAEEQLLNAATRGDMYRVRVLLTVGAAVDARNQSGQTALICAAMNGHDEVVRMLLEAGAAAKAEDAFGLTALQWAVRRNFTKTERLLKNATHAAAPTNCEINYAASQADSTRIRTDGPLIKQSASAVEPKMPGLEEAGPAATPQASVDVPPDESDVKHCPRCRTSYNSPLLFYCSYDAAPLVDGAGVPPVNAPTTLPSASTPAELAARKTHTRVTTFCLSLVFIYLLYPVTTGPSSAGPFGSREAQAGRHLLDIDAPMPYLRQGNPAKQFEALRQVVMAGAGFDFLAKCGDMFRPRAAKFSKPGVSFLSRHKAGDAFDYNQEDPRVLIVREQVGGSTYWRTYLTCQKQDGTQGVKTTLRTDNAGRVSAYVFDFTAVAEKLGWERIPALAGWQREPNKKEFWHYEMTEGLSFDFAAALVNPEPRRKGGRSRSVGPKAWR